MYRKLISPYIMKKITYIFLLLLWFSVLQLDVFAVSYTNPGSFTPTTIRGWGPNRGTQCNSNAVPQDSQTDTAAWDAVTWSFDCRTHNYYAASAWEYTRNTIANGITLCDWEDMVVGRDGATSRIICRRWDDWRPTVNTSSLAYSRHNTWTNLDGTVTFWADDVPVSSSNGTVESGVANNATRYCWWSTCTLANPSDGTAANSVVVNSQQNRVLRYRTWDRNGNASVIRSANVMIDKTAPTLTTTLSWPTVGVISNDTWSNENISSSVVCSDTWWSWCSNIQRKVSSSSFSCSSSWGWTNGSSYTHSTPNNTNKIEYICYRVRDNANNWYTYSGLQIIKIDKVSPTLNPVVGTDVRGDVENEVPINLLANDSYNYWITISENGWSPVKDISYSIENHSNTSSTEYFNESVTYLPSPANTYSYRFDWNIENVDIDRIPNWSREYSFIITQICDEAGNCSNFTNWNVYNHAVYSNTTNIASSISKNDLSGPIYADGTRREIEVTLTDEYGNFIIDAPGIGRNIDINISTINEIRLDQYNNSWTDSALFVWTETNPISISSSPSDTVPSNFDDIISTDGTYTLPFFVYAPTTNTDERVLWSGAIVWVTYDIDASTQIETGDRPQNQWVSDFIYTPIRATPLYATTMLGWLTQQWFLEWAIQDLDIYVSNSGITTYNNSLRAEFWDVDESDPSNPTNIENARYSFTISGATISELPQNPTELYNLSSGIIPNYLNANTFMVQDGSVTNETFSYLASIVKYDVRTWTARKTVVYPSDVYWKDTYIGPSGENNSYQEGAKILGNTSSSHSQELTENQFSSDIKIIWQITKSTLRRDVAKNVYEVIKNIKDSELLNGSWDVNELWWISAWSSLNNDGKRIYWNRVLYFRGQDVEISGDTIQWNKTLLVENGDVYISWNITWNWVLWIIVLNGNILIKNTLTDIHAILYTDKSVLSTTNGTDVLDWSDTAAELANQLYIKWSIFSENTIGGSRKATPECPYYVTTNCDTESKAQAYDLNYLRRYFMYYSETADRNDPPDKSSWAQSLSAVAWWYERYPVVIEYNPVIQTTPPPFFE